MTTEVYFVEQDFTVEFPFASPGAAYTAGLGISIVAGVITNTAPASATPATAIVDGTTVALPPNKQVLSIAVTAAAGSRTLTVGTSAAATDVIDSEVIPTNTDQNLPVGIFTSTGLTLHFSGFIGTVRVYIL